MPHRSILRLHRIYPVRLRHDLFHTMRKRLSDLFLLLDHSTLMPHQICLLLRAYLPFRGIRYRSVSDQNLPTEFTPPRSELTLFTKIGEASGTLLFSQRFRFVLVLEAHKDVMSITAYVSSFSFSFLFLEICVYDFSRCSSRRSIDYRNIVDLHVLEVVLKGGIRDGMLVPFRSQNVDLGVG